MKRGFTLIELLAVIVIVAIIALIAVPIVVNIINDSKTSSEKESAKLYINAVKVAVTKENLKEKIDPNLCEVKENSIVCDKNVININIANSTPKSGFIIFKDGKIKSSCLNYDNNSYRYKKGNYEQTNFCEMPICNSKDLEGSTELGTKYSCKVNDTKSFNFYVLDYDETTKQVSLIMDSNICPNGEVATNNTPCRCSWANSNQISDGPDKALQNIYDATKEWNNIPNIILNYSNEGYSDNYGYKSIITDLNTLETKIVGKDDSIKLTVGNLDSPLKARLPKVKELKDAGCGVARIGENTQKHYGTCPVWLIENLKYWDVTYNAGSNHTDKYIINKDKNLEDVRGYWTMSSYNSRDNYSYYMYHPGSVEELNSTWVLLYIGTRPVIEIPEDRLS